MSYDDHMSTESVARFYPLPHRDRCRIEATASSVTVQLDVLGCQFTANELEALIDDLIAAQDVLLGAHQNHIDSGFCRSIHQDAWCSGLAGHDGNHWARRTPNPDMPVDALVNPARVEWA